MSQRVVDDLEAVKVQEHHGQLLLTAARVGDGQVEPVLEQGAVWQSGQQVVVGLEVDKGFRFLTLGHIAGSTVVAGLATIVFAVVVIGVGPGFRVNRKRGNFKVSGGFAAASGLEPNFQCPGIVGADIRAFQSIGSPGDVPVIQDVAKVTPAQLSGLVAKQALNLAVHKTEMPVAIEHENDIG